MVVLAQPNFSLKVGFIVPVSEKNHKGFG